MKHDLTTAQGVFGYFAEHTEILKPIEVEFKEKDEKIATLKAENEMQGNIIADLDFRLMLGGM